MIINERKMRAAVGGLDDFSKHTKLVFQICKEARSDNEKEKKNSTKMTADYDKK